MRFSITFHDSGSGARTGRLVTGHGFVDTPVFMPVGTAGTVKAMDPGILNNLGAQIILGNTYHLLLRPGHELIRDFGGLHSFIGWEGSMLTDSGGFQIFSIREQMSVDDDGLSFRSHIDGTRHFMSPEDCIAIQHALGPDIMMVLDHLTPKDASEKEISQAMRRTIDWAFRCLTHHKNSQSSQALFAIQQGGFDDELRARCIEQLREGDFDGFAVGGLSIGEEKEIMMDTAAASAPLLPEEKPRYVMGVGTPEDLFALVSMGYDMFDCVLPTRNARTGLLYTSRGTLVIKNARFRDDHRPIDPSCSCAVCQRFTRAYLRHLFVSKEVLGIILNTHHNLHFYLNMMAGMRQAIRNKRFVAHRDQFLSEYSMGIAD